MNTLQRIALVAFAAFLIVGLLWMQSCREARTAKTQADLAKGQAGAAMQSGQDAVETLGNRMEADAATDQITRDNADAIRNAQGADAPVAAPVRDAGIASLCRRAAYRSDPRCM